MSSDRDEGYLLQVETEERKALEFLDQTEREFFDAIQRARMELERDDPGRAQPAKAEFDREEAEARARFAATREETKKHFLQLREG